MIVDELMLQRVARDRRFDARTVEIARHLFLRKEAPRKVAREFALVDKRIYAIRAEVLRQAEKYALPPGCAEVTLRGPAEVIRATEAFFTQQMEATGSSRQSGMADETGTQLPDQMALRTTRR